MTDKNPINLALWESVQATDPLFTKQFERKGGFRGTSINATYLAKKATEKFGPIGLGWGVNITDEKYQEGAAGEIVHVLQIELWYILDGKTGIVRHFGQTVFVGKNKYGPYTDEEAPKKSLTDAMTKALSLLGFGADVHLGLYDDAEYMHALKRHMEDAAATQRPAGADRRETMAAAEEHGTVETPDGNVTREDAVRRRVDSSTIGARLRTCKTLEDLQELVEGEKYLKWRDGLEPETKHALLTLQAERFEALQKAAEGPPQDQEALISELGDRYAEASTLIELDDVNDAYGERVNGLSLANRERVADLHGKNQRRILTDAAGLPAAPLVPRLNPEPEGSPALVRDPDPLKPYSELVFHHEDHYRQFIKAQISAVQDSADALRLKSIWNETKEVRRSMGLTGGKSIDMQTAVRDVLKFHSIPIKTVAAASPTQH